MRKATRVARAETTIMARNAGTKLPVTSETHPKMSGALPVIGKETNLRAALRAGNTSRPKKPATSGPVEESAPP